MARKEHFTVFLDADIARKIDSLVREGFYPSLSALIRDAILRFLNGEKYVDKEQPKCPVCGHPIDLERRGRKLQCWCNCCKSRITVTLPYRNHLVKAGVV